MYQLRSIVSPVKPIKGKRALSNLSYIHNIGKEPLRPITLGQLLKVTADKYHDRPAVISRHQTKTLTFGDVAQEADSAAAGLRAVGLERGDRVGIWLPNQYEWCILMMACARAGLKLVALNPAFQAPEIEYCINKVGMKAIICGHDFRKQNYYDIMNMVAPELPQCDPCKLRSKNTPSLNTVIMATKDSLRGTYNYKELLDLSNRRSMKNIKDNQHLISPNECCHILFTSGTTGKPKAAMLSHFGVVNNSYETSRRAGLSAKHHKLCAQVPLFHAFGTSLAIVGSFHFGTTIVLPGHSFNANESLDAIKNEQCTVIYGTPTMYVDLIEAQSKRKEKISPEIALTGGAPCSPHLFQKIQKTLNLREVKSVYGQTEASAVIFQSFPGDDDQTTRHTVGHVGDHLEVKVVDPDGNTVPIGQPGELCVRGYLSMLGYWDDVEKTRQAMDSDRWLKTGDQFILESSGYGRVVGRLKEMIIRGGEKIFPKEIEDLINTHPNITESYVIGLHHNRLGEEVCACIRLKKGTTLTHEKLVSFCKGKIAHFKIPSKLQIMEAFPKTTSGKIQKFKLKRILEETKKPIEEPTPQYIESNSVFII